MFRLNVSRAKLSKIQRVTTFADRHWAGEKSPARGRAVFSCCFYCKGCVKWWPVILIEAGVDWD